LALSHGLKLLVRSQVAIGKGISSSAALEVAARPQSRGLRIAVILPDSGERYMSLPFFPA